MAIAGFFTLFALFLAITAAGIYCEAWVLTHLWAWFVAPMVGIQLSIPVAAGLALIAALLTHQQQGLDGADDVSDQLLRLLASAFGRPALALAGGWVIRQFL